MNTLSAATAHHPAFAEGELLYANPLTAAENLAGWVREGATDETFDGGGLCLQNGLDPALGQAANFLLWCPVKFPAEVAVRWRFRPLREPGLAMFWWSADGRAGRDLFDRGLAPRRGEYRQYHSGEINGYHLSYFRRKHPTERAFHTVNLRKSHGFHLVAQGADPLPDVADAVQEYELCLISCAGWVVFLIEQLEVLCWRDAGTTGGPPHPGGYLGFRQMAPLAAHYRDLRVHAVTSLQPAASDQAGRPSLHS